MVRATWKPYEKHGELTARSDLPSSVFAYPKERKEPMTDASHVRNAIARFDQVRGVSDAERDLAFANIKKAAKYYGVELHETSWHELGRQPRTRRTAAARKKSARKAAATRKKRGTATGSTPARKRGAKRAAATRKKTSSKKTASKKTSRKKTSSKKTPIKKTARKKTARKKTTRKKAPKA